MYDKIIKKEILFLLFIDAKRTIHATVKMKMKTQLTHLCLPQRITVTIVMKLNVNGCVRAKLQNVFTNLTWLFSVSLDTFCKICQSPASNQVKSPATSKMHQSEDAMSV